HSRQVAVGDVSSETSASGAPLKRRKKSGLRPPLGACAELRPVPRLVGESVNVVAAVRHRKKMPLRVVLKPCESPRAVEFVRQRTAAGRRDVDGAARMVLAEARRRIHLEYRRDVLARCELLAGQGRFVTPRSE